MFFKGEKGEQCEIYIYIYVYFLKNKKKVVLGKQRKVIFECCYLWGFFSI